MRKIKELVAIKPKTEKFGLKNSYLHFYNLIGRFRINCFIDISNHKPRRFLKHLRLKV